MPRTITVADLEKKIRWRCSQDNSFFVKQDELIAYIDEAATELHDLLISRFADYYIQYADFTTDQGVDVYQLPADFLKLRGLDLIKDNTYKIEAFPFEERERYVNAKSQSLPFNVMKYCILGNTILLAPTPQAGLSMRLWYTPALPIITKSNQQLSSFNGWTSLIIASVCAMIANKAEESPTPFLNEKKDIIKRIEEAAQMRDSSGSGRVVDTAGTNDDFNIFPFIHTGV